MEITSFSRLSGQEASEKGTNRTLKPADRCVISYNFEQNNTSNYTHNLLIGMNNDLTTKVHKNTPNSSLNHSSTKIAAVSSHQKKIFRQEPARISKVYGADMSTPMYINTHSPHKNSRLSQEGKIHP